MTIITESAHANIVRSMSNEELGQFVAEGVVGILHRLDDLRPYYEELWCRFDALKDGETISGCKTRTEFCDRILKRSVRSIQYALNGRPQPRLLTSETSNVQRLHESGFVRRCQDPVLRALVLEQARCLDSQDIEEQLMAATLEGKIVGHIWNEAEARRD